MRGTRPRPVVRWVVVLLWTLSLVLGIVAAEAPAGASDGWLSEVRGRIEASEYDVTWQTETGIPGLDAAYHAPNRAHGFRTYFTETGFRSRPRTPEGGAWEWGLTWIGYGRGGTSWTVTPAALSAKGNRVELERGALREWFVNDSRGLEQGFLLSSPPEEAAVRLASAELGGFGTVGVGREVEAEPLVHVDLALSGDLAPRFSTDGRSIDFVAPSGLPVLRYAELRVVDANDRELPSWMEGFSGPGLRGVRLVIDARNAVYPLTVDPLATSPAWIGESNQLGANYGFSVGTAGDVNGDGYSDVIVGAHFYDNGTTDEGAAFVYLGSPSGLSKTHVWMGDSNQGGSRYGATVRAAGDLNGDGLSEIIVGANAYTNGGSAKGRAFLYYGTPTGPATFAAWVTEGFTAFTEWGISAGSAGDVNGDGFGDLMVGAWGYDNVETNEGAAYVFHGSPSGVSSIPTIILESNVPGAFFGGSVSTAGDVNGDGFSDVVVGASFLANGQSEEGRAYLFLGSASGLSGTPAWMVESDQAFANFGFPVSTAGDVNGDGFADVIVGAARFNNDQTDEGRAFLYLGSASGLSTTAVWTAESDFTSGNLSHCSTAGDVNGDGYGDVVVGAPGFGSLVEGKAWVYLGSSAGLSTVAAWTVVGPPISSFGNVAAAGDVNGDGYGDVLVGANGYDNGQTDEGGAFVYLGSPSGPSLTAGWTVEGDQNSANVGVSVASAGDVNGDGYGDVVVGAWMYDNGETDEGRAYTYFGGPSGLATSPAWIAEGNQAGALFGTSVSTAGDVNNDGYADVVVGAIHYDNLEVDEGRAYVYHGGPGGLSITPAWTAEGDQAVARFGYNVGPAGDVNGDGYGDVVVSAAFYDNGEADEGRSYAYLGSPSGLQASPSWVTEGNQAAALYGVANTTAGDVNGDGYSDVIVGVQNYDNGQTDEGRAYIYHGSPSGLSLSPARTLEGDQASALFGYSVASAGDVNGDGYSDVIVGARQYDNGTENEGRAYVYHGSATGIPATAQWSTESDNSFGHYGHFVASAGDVNGDGFGDVIVGAVTYTNGQASEGKAFVYQGSAVGLSTVPAWTAEGDQLSANYGIAVASAGDVNGDGYGDIIVGAYLYDNGETNEGRAYLYYGNGGPGMSLRPQQRASSDARPVGHLGASDTPEAFRVAMLGRTPFGSGQVKLEWETKPLGFRMNGIETKVAVHATNTGAAGASLSELETGLLELAPYHWRARLRYGVTTPFAPASRWLTVPVGGWNETMLRAGDPAAAGAISGGSLRIGKGAGVTITLAWGASCMPNDADYEVYEGTLGDFTSHEARYCGTSGATTRTFTPLAGNTYYLVVAANGTREGSYGRDSSGVERPQGAFACLPQQIGACP